MTEKFNQVKQLVAGLRIDDLVDPKTHKLLDVLTVINDLQRISRMYTSTGHCVLADQLDRDRYLKAEATRRNNLKIVGEWCKKYVKVGDWVKVRHSGTKSSYRKVLQLELTEFRNRPGDPVMDSVTGYNTVTAYCDITHLMNPTTRLMERIDVKKILESANQE